MGYSSGARAAAPIVNEQMRGALSAVERDTTINAVTLDATEQGLCVECGHGKRGYCYAEENEELSILRVKGKNVLALVNKLCRYYRNAGGDSTIILILKVFLECSLMYLNENATNKELNYSSLEKLARTVQHNGQCSRFEILMGDKSMSAFDRFCELYTVSTQRDLVMALQRIMEYLEIFHGRVHIQFVIGKRRNTKGGK